MAELGRFASIQSWAVVYTRVTGRPAERYQRGKNTSTGARSRDSTAGLTSAGSAFRAELTF